ncbi:MAG: methyl-accepting chemotaxis protein [Telluria sp.]
MMSKLLTLTIARKLWLLIIAMGAGITLLTTLFLVSERSLIIEERTNAVRQVVEVAHGIAVHFHSLVAKGTLSEADAMSAALQAIKALRYSGGEYFWINDMQPAMVMHPINAALDGTNLAENKDPNGKLLFIEMVSMVRARGEGMLAYMWPKPGQEGAVSKISYVKGFAPWGWVIGSGVYMDNVNTIFLERAAKFGLAALALTALLTMVGILLARSISRPLERAVEIAQTVARGDLTSHITVTGRDETGKLLQALKDMNDSLLGIVSEVNAGTVMIATASAQIASGNADLSSRTEEQASALEETASSMEQLTAAVRQNAEHARQANTLAESASGVAVKGGRIVSQVVDTMASINGSSRKIVEIIAVIDGIAFQTNILALNAAVEAARAGEQGRGFAVVASEVRTLAQRSASAAKQIKGLIEDSVQKVDLGDALVHQAGATMDEIVASVKRVTDIMGDVAGATREQEAGIGQINQAVMEMDGVTQQNAALVEQAAAAAAALQQQAEMLANAVSVFKLDTGAPAAAKAPLVRAPNAPVRLSMRAQTSI